MQQYNEVNTQAVDKNELAEKQQLQHKQRPKQHSGEDQLGQKRACIHAVPHQKTLVFYGKLIKTKK